MDVAEEERTDSALADSVVEAVDDAPQSGFWRSLRRRFFPTAEDRADDDKQRLQALDKMIALHPDVAVNYVSRGELHLKNDEPEHALADFRRGFELASHQVEHANWGIIDQVMQDRAQRGIEVAERKLKRRSGSLPDNLRE